MLIITGDRRMRIHDAAINLLTENPFKFPRPKGCPAVTVEGGTKRPGITFLEVFEYLYEEGGNEALRLLSLSPYTTADMAGFTFKVSRYPWTFTYKLLPRCTIFTQDVGPLIKKQGAWDSLFSLIITSAEIKYKERPTGE